VDLASLGTFNVYLFDGPHSDKDQYDGLVLATPALTREFILIVDDWNWEPVRRGSLAGIRALNLSLKYSLEIRTTLDGTHGPVMGQLGDWHTATSSRCLRSLEVQDLSRHEEAGDVLGVIPAGTGTMRRLLERTSFTETPA
jgi:hypothetical protein